jgi:hypothetical protein
LNAAEPSIQLPDLGKALNLAALLRTEIATKFGINELPEVSL